MELEPRITAPAHATGAVAFVPVDAISDDVTLRLREEGDVATLASSIGRLGQLAPVELRLLPDAPADAPRYQVVAGFRRLAALRLLMRERVLARVHVRLSDDDAWGIALGEALLTEPLDEPALLALRERLAASGVAPWADELVDEARVRAPLSPELRERFLAYVEGAVVPLAAPAEGEDHGEDEPREAEPDDSGADAAGGLEDVDIQVEVTPEELVEDLTRRMWEVNQDLALAAESWAELPPEGRREILTQARYVAAVLAHLGGGSR